MTELDWTVLAIGFAIFLAGMLVITIVQGILERREDRLWREHWIEVQSRRSHMGGGK